MILEPRDVENMLWIIGEDPVHPPETTDLAAEMNVSERTARRAIGELFGQPPTGVARHLTMAQAAHRLANSYELIRQIAWDAGYSCVQAFDRAFREQYGCTPSEYRAKTPPHKDRPDYPVTITMCPCLGLIATFIYSDRMLLDVQLPPHEQYDCYNKSSKADTGPRDIADVPWPMPYGIGPVIVL